MWAKLINRNIVEVKELSSKLKMWRFKTPHYA